MSVLRIITVRCSTLRLPRLQRGRRGRSVRASSTGVPIKFAMKKLLAFAAFLVCVASLPASTREPLQNLLDKLLLEGESFHGDLSTGPTETMEQIRRFVRTHSSERASTASWLEAKVEEASGPKKRMFFEAALAVVTERSEIAEAVFNSAPRGSRIRFLLMDAMREKLREAKRYEELLEAGAPPDFELKWTRFLSLFERTSMPPEMKAEMQASYRAEFWRECVAACEALAATHRDAWFLNLANSMLAASPSRAEKDQLRSAVVRSGRPELWLALTDAEGAE